MPVVIQYLSNFLKSPDVLRLSGTCVFLRKLFNDNYWSTYLLKIPRAHSYLVLHGPLSPALDRKVFFLIYGTVKELINLASKLNHPEALILLKYGSYGAYIGRDRYLCPSGPIRHVTLTSDIFLSSVNFNTPLSSPQWKLEDHY